MGQINPVSRTFASFERIPLLPEQWTGWRDALGITARRLAMRLAGLSLMVSAIGCAIALLTYDANDPSWNNASAAATQNALGPIGATLSDLLVQSFGAASILAIVPPLLWGIWMVDGRIGLRLASRSLCWILSIIALATCAGLLPVQLFTDQPVASGGAVGEALFRMIAASIGSLGIPTPEIFAGMLPGVAGSMLMAWAIGLNPFQVSMPAMPVSSIRDGLSDLAARITSAVAGMFGAARAEARVEPRLVRQPDMFPGTIVDQPTPAPMPAQTGPRITIPALRKPAVPAPGPERSARLEIDSDYELPELDLLKQNKRGQGFRESTEALHENARMLESVLADFGVKGQIIQVLPGPVVTLYEFEPAAGVKGARVISLADDIARSMKAVSARVAVVPGKNAIGIELPTQRREMVQLRELLSTDEYDNANIDLALALGKNIAGEPVVADLARMPHLLIAGTTGSGKSVAINTMILSLLYRLSPDQCKLIMIDPKMLELSAYDGIPHLLSPVVTDPKKAIVALKWTVREMEDRYRRMQKMGVRNIKGYNERIAKAKAKGELLKRTVQTGFDSQTGEALYEDETLPLEHMPYIVVIVDEMADLMMVAGKDIEAAVQRLAQMARASGIHIITATQRPSVDVITGTIKANFPTRISFQVTSKIDSRTILGEQGAEQLLGQGDMLLMEGGGRIRRVHGPYVSDEEVEEVVKYLRTQGEPVYIEDITQEPEEPEAGDLLETEGEGSGDDLYDQAVAIVSRDRRATTSYIQRRLQIGYNRAARIIEKMEEEGVISAPNHAGKRDVLVGDHSGRGG
ncbi:MAG: DNA translocase FtsK [Alphaproteobacteria bacterium]|nr:DNA translocase FtsK [Alphaproteobacteria bacterium]